MWYELNNFELIVINAWSYYWVFARYFRYLWSYAQEYFLWIIGVKKFLNMIFHIRKFFGQCFPWLDHAIAVVYQILRLFKEEIYQAKVIGI